MEGNFRNKSSRLDNMEDLFHSLQQTYAGDDEKAPQDDYTDSLSALTLSDVSLGLIDLDKVPESSVSKFLADSLFVPVAVNGGGVPPEYLVPGGDGGSPPSEDLSSTTTHDANAPRQSVGESSVDFSYVSRDQSPFTVLGGRKPSSTHSDSHVFPSPALPPLSSGTHTSSLPNVSLHHHRLPLPHPDRGHLRAGLSSDKHPSSSSPSSSSFHQVGLPSLGDAAEGVRIGAARLPHAPTPPSQHMERPQGDGEQNEPTAQPNPPPIFDSRTPSLSSVEDDDDGGGGGSGGDGDSGGGDSDGDGGDGISSTGDSDLTPSEVSSMDDPGTGDEGVGERLGTEGREESRQPPPQLLPVSALENRPLLEMGDGEGSNGDDVTAARDSPSGHGLQEPDGDNRGGERAVVHRGGDGVDELSSEGDFASLSSNSVGEIPPTASSTTPAAVEEGPGVSSMIERDSLLRPPIEAGQEVPADVWSSLPPPSSSSDSRCAEATPPPDQQGEGAGGVTLPSASSSRSCFLSGGALIHSDHQRPVVLGEKEGERDHLLAAQPTSVPLQGSTPPVVAAVGQTFAPEGSALVEPSPSAPLAVKPSASPPVAVELSASAPVVVKPSASEDCVTTLSFRATEGVTSGVRTDAAVGLTQPVLPAHQPPNTTARQQPTTLAEGGRRRGSEGGSTGHLPSLGMPEAGNVLEQLGMLYPAPGSEVQGGRGTEGGVSRSSTASDLSSQESLDFGISRVSNPFDADFTGMASGMGFDSANVVNASVLKEQLDREESVMDRFKSESDTFARWSGASQQTSHQRLADLTGASGSMLNQSVGTYFATKSANLASLNLPCSPEGHLLFSEEEEEKEEEEDSTPSTPEEEPDNTLVWAGSHDVTPMSHDISVVSQDIPSLTPQQRSVASPSGPTVSHDSHMQSLEDVSVDTTLVGGWASAHSSLQLGGSQRTAVPSTPQGPGTGGDQRPGEPVASGGSVSSASSSADSSSSLGSLQSSTGEGTPAQLTLSSSSTSSSVAGRGVTELSFVIPDLQTEEVEQDRIEEVHSTAHPPSFSIDTALSPTSRPIDPALPPTSRPDATEESSRVVTDDRCSPNEVISAISSTLLVSDVSITTIVGDLDLSGVSVDGVETPRAEHLTPAVRLTHSREGEGLWAEQRQQLPTADRGSISAYLQQSGSVSTLGSSGSGACSLAGKSWGALTRSDSSLGGGSTASEGNSVPYQRLEECGRSLPSEQEEQEAESLPRDPAPQTLGDRPRPVQAQDFTLAPPTLPPPSLQRALDFGSAFRPDRTAPAGVEPTSPPTTLPALSTGVELATPGPSEAAELSSSMQLFAAGGGGGVHVTTNTAPLGPSVVKSCGAAPAQFHAPLPHAAYAPPPPASATLSHRHSTPRQYSPAHTSPGSTPHTSPGISPHTSPGISPPHTSPGISPHTSPGISPHTSTRGSPHTSTRGIPHTSTRGSPHTSTRGSPHTSTRGSPHTSPLGPASSPARPAVRGPERVVFDRVCCVGCRLEESCPLQSRCERWTESSFALLEVFRNGEKLSSDQCDMFTLPSPTHLSPKASGSVKVEFVPRREGVYEAILQISSSPLLSMGPRASGQEAGPRTSTVLLKARAEQPQVKVLVGGKASEAVDFGVLQAGSSRSLRVHLLNEGLSDLPLQLAVDTASPLWHCFTLEDVPKALLAHTHHLVPSSTTVSVVLPANPSLVASLSPLKKRPSPSRQGRRRSDLAPAFSPAHLSSKSHSFALKFHAPTRSSAASLPCGPLTEVEAALLVKQEGGELCRGRELVRVGLQASVGVAKLVAPAHNSQPIKMAAAPGRTTAVDVPLKNAGNMPVEVILRVSPSSSPQQSTLSVTPTRLRFEVGEELSCMLLYSAPERPGSARHALALQVEPAGPVYRLSVTTSSDPAHRPGSDPAHRPPAQSGGSGSQARHQHSKRQAKPQQQLDASQHPPSPPQAQSAAAAAVGYPLPRGSFRPTLSSDAGTLLCDRQLIHWGCVGAGEVSREVLTLRSNHGSPAVLTLTVVDQHSSFSLLQEVGGASTSSRTCVVGSKDLKVDLLFRPLARASYRDVLCIRDNSHNKLYKIPLGGFGGRAQVAVTNCRDTPGGPEVDCGMVVPGTKKAVTVKVRNRGERAAFVNTSCSSSLGGPQQLAASPVVAPSSCVLQPHSTQELLVICQTPSDYTPPVWPTDQGAEPVGVAKLTLTWVDEVMRERFHRSRLNDPHYAPPSSVVGFLHPEPLEGSDPEEIEGVRLGGGDDETQLFLSRLDTTAVTLVGLVGSGSVSSTTSPVRPPLLPSARSVGVGSEGLGPGLPPGTDWGGPHSSYSQSPYSQMGQSPLLGHSSLPSGQAVARTNGPLQPETLRPSSTRARSPPKQASPSSTSFTPPEPLHSSLPPFLVHAQVQTTPGVAAGLQHTSARLQNTGAGLQHTATGLLNPLPESHGSGTQSRNVASGLQHRDSKLQHFKQELRHSRPPVQQQSWPPAEESGAGGGARVVDPLGEFPSFLDPEERKRVLPAETVIFPSVPVQASSEQSFQVCNPRSAGMCWFLSQVSAPVIRAAVTPTSAQTRETSSVFWVHQHSGTVRGGSAVEVPVTFHPHSAGTYSQMWSLSVRHRDQPSKRMTLSLVGQATPTTATPTTTTPTTALDRPETPPSLSISLHHPRESPGALQHQGRSPSVNSGIAREVADTFGTKKASKKAVVYFEKAVVKFPLTPSGQRSSKKIKVCNGDSQPNKFTVIAPYHPFSIDHHKFELKPRQYARLPIHFAPTEAGEIFTSVLAVKTDSGHQFFTELRASAT